MPPSSSEQPISRSPARLAISRPTRVEPVKLDVVGAVDHRRPEHRTVTEDDLPQALRQAGLDQQLVRPQGRQRGLRVGLEHHRVAGQERRQGVADRQRERVVPGRDDADDAARMVQLVDAGGNRHQASSAARAQVALRAHAVVARHDRDVADLLERVLARLAGLELDQVERLGLSREHQVVEAQQHPSPVGQRPFRPVLLCAARDVVRRGDVVGRRHRQVGERLTGPRRRGRVQLGARTGRDGTNQARDERSVDRGLLGPLRTHGRRHG